MLTTSPGHHWTVTACSGMGIGEKAAEHGFKILAEGAYEAMQNPELIEKCWKYYHSLNIPDYEDLYNRVGI